MIIQQEAPPHALIAPLRTVYGPAMTEHAKLLKIIEQKRVRPVFQPIISIKEKRIVGFEALSRGVDPESGRVIPPPWLFATARKFDLSLAFDRLCREKAIADFASAGLPGEPLLFLNFDPSILTQVIVGNAWLKKRVCESGLKPDNVAIEIVESKVENDSSLIRFVEIYRDFGFLIVLDDFGAQHSNLDRILRLKPDIIKIDRELIHNVSRDYYKQSIVGSIIGLADKLGTVVLAEGVEQVEDIIQCSELGICLFQGFHFAKPTGIQQIPPDFCHETIRETSVKLYHHLNIHVTRQMEIQAVYRRITQELCGRLSGRSQEEFDGLLRGEINHFDRIQCLYVLNYDGHQAGQTICRSEAFSPLRRRLFNPAVKGADHSLKSYYYYMQILRLDRFYTDPYVSTATGRICRTMSARFKDGNGKPFILCVDFNIT